MIFLKFLKRKAFTLLRLIIYKFFISHNRKKKFHQDFKKLETNIKQKKNFAFLRFSDGELFVLQNKKLVISENFWSLDNEKKKASFASNEKKSFLPNKHQFYRKQLLNSLKFSKKNYYKGIACTCCNGKASVNFMKKIANSMHYLTFSNLFQNGNYPNFVKIFFELFKKRKIIIIANQTAVIKYLPFKVKKKFSVGENCFINNYSLIQTLKRYIKEHNIINHVFLISAASLSNLIVYKLFKNNHKNTYIDVGSTLNYHFYKRKGSQSRSYLWEYWGGKRDIEYLNRSCYW
jgi:hypothetical protein